MHTIFPYFPILHTVDVGCVFWRCVRRASTIIDVRSVALSLLCVTGSQRALHTSDPGDPGAGDPGRANLLRSLTKSITIHNSWEFMISNDILMIHLKHRDGHGGIWRDQWSSVETSGNMSRPNALFMKQDGKKCVAGRCFRVFLKAFWACQGKVQSAFDH